VKRPPPFLLGILLSLLPGCAADPFGAPPRVTTHGYRARVTLKSDGVEKASFDVAVFRSLRRKGPANGPALVLDMAARVAFRLDPASKTARDVPFSEAVGELPGGIPLVPGFDEKAEAERRHVGIYHREGDEVFAGHVCALWRYDDDLLGGEGSGRPRDAVRPRGDRRGRQNAEVHRDPHGRAGGCGSRPLLGSGRLDPALKGIGSLVCRHRPCWYPPRPAAPSGGRQGVRVPP